MKEVGLVARALGLLPGMVHGVEQQCAGKTGAEKKAAVLEMLRLAVDVADAATGEKIADPEGFATGLGLIVDGVVGCLKASVWARG